MVAEQVEVLVPLFFCDEFRPDFFIRWFTGFFFRRTKKIFFIFFIFLFIYPEKQ